MLSGSAPTGRHDLNSGNRQTKSPTIDQMSRPLMGTVTLIEKCSSAVGFGASRPGSGGRVQRRRGAHSTDPPGSPTLTNVTVPTWRSPIAIRDTYRVSV